jgi:predicted DNA-binding transcriptional regulator AlpA
VRTSKAKSKTERDDERRARDAERRARDAERRRQAKERRAVLRQTVPADQQRPNPFTIYRTQRLAELLDVDRSCIWRWRRDGVLPEPVEIGGVKGWTFAQIEHLIAQSAGR